ncbi:unnamed protein product, partial [Hapterophycus canaliculatus]
ATDLSSVKAISKEAEDPVMALSIIGQLTGRAFDLNTAGSTNDVMAERDTTLANLEIDQQLVPLIIERNKSVAEFGESHPSVKHLDTEITLMKSELKRLVAEQINRRMELREENKVDLPSPIENARQALKVIVLALNAEVSLLEQQIKELDNQVQEEKLEAIALGKFEQEDAAMLREIDRNRQLIDQFEEKLARVSLTEEEGGISVTELSATSKASRVGPDMSKSLSMGGFLGIALGCALAFLLEKNASTFRDPDEIVKAVSAPILTHVPFFKGKVRRSRKGEPNPFEKLDPHLAVVHTPSSVPAEAIRSCRTSLFFELTNVKGGKIIQLSSPLPGDGKSTIAGNLACSIAQSGKKTLLIDCDLRRPQTSDNFGVSEKLGLIDILNGDCEPVDAIHDTPLATLKLLPSGPIPANPAEALTLPEMSELLAMLRDQFDYIIVDTPPLLVVTDPSILASTVDAVVMALKIRRKSKPNTREAANILRTVGANLVGVVIRSH